MLLLSADSPNVIIYKAVLSDLMCKRFKEFRYLVLQPLGPLNYPGMTISNLFFKMYTDFLSNKEFVSKLAYWCIGCLAVSTEFQELTWSLSFTNGAMKLRNINYNKYYLSYVIIVQNDRF